MLEILGVTITFGRTRPTSLVTSRSMGIGISGDLPTPLVGSPDQKPSGHPCLDVFLFGGNPRWRSLSDRRYKNVAPGRGFSTLASTEGSNVL
jgi:hypothetical protein